MAGVQRVATRVISSTGSVVYYLHADHLGSASLTTNASGNKLGELRYSPYGVTRYVWGATPTDRRFTGQRSEEASLGSLYDYGARMYSPVLGRFLSADTMVPSPGNPQDLNRYSYVRNSPARYTDPTGHYSFEEMPDDPLVYHGSDSRIVRSYRYSASDQVISPAQRQRALQQYSSRVLYDQRRQGKLTDVDFLAELCDYRALFGDPTSFVDEISRVILGGKGGLDTILYAPAHRNHLDLGDRGFAAYYRDGSNQVNHAWYGVHIAHFFGHEVAARIQAGIHESNIPVAGGGRLVIPGTIVNIPGGGASHNDYALTRSGGSLGVGIRNGSISIQSVGTWIRANWGPWPPQHFAEGW